jgi:hypothetical protein
MINFAQPKKSFPKAISFSKIIGPSFILLGLGLGSGEVILWPYLVSNYGLGIIWAAVLGIFFQFFINMEVERYSLLRGESIIVGYYRKFKGVTIWLLLSTLIPWIWPGIVASSAKIFGNLIGIKEFNYLGIILLILIGVILTVGKVLYKTIETFQKILIFISIPTILFLTYYLSSTDDYIRLAEGFIGIGEGYFLIPAGISLATLLSAFAYSGAAGNLNLAQSYYVREKGYGMGKYVGRLTGLFNEEKEKVSISGYKPELNKTTLIEFKKWWKVINLEHFIVFFLMGGMTILLLAFLSYSTTHPDGKFKDIEFLFYESTAITEKAGSFFGILFLLICAFTLFGTQLTVLDATSRILAENTLLMFPKYLSEKKIPNIYYLFLWIQLISGIVIFSINFGQPLQLLIIAAVLNAFAMFIHTGLSLWTNLTLLEKEFRPSRSRLAILITIFLTYGFFSIYTIYTEFLKFF